MGIRSILHRRRYPEDDSPYVWKDIRAENQLVEIRDRGVEPVVKEPPTDWRYILSITIICYILHLIPVMF